MRWSEMLKSDAELIAAKAQQFGNTDNNLSLYSNKSGRWDSNPRRSPWEGDILPLNYTRKYLSAQTKLADIIALLN